MFNTDSAGQQYVEVSLSGGSEKIRATLVRNGARGAVAVRMQIVDEKGHLRQGPEVAVADFAALNQELFKALAMDGR